MSIAIDGLNISLFIWILKDPATFYELSKTMSDLVSVNVSRLQGSDWKQSKLVL